MFMVINVHNAHQDDGKVFMLLTLIAPTMAVSLYPHKVLLRARIILVIITFITTNFGAVLVRFLQPTGAWFSGYL